MQAGCLPGPTRSVDEQLMQTARIRRRTTPAAHEIVVSSTGASMAVDDTGDAGSLVATVDRLDGNAREADGRDSRRG
jgi:hypothetical protein